MNSLVLDIGEVVSAMGLTPATLRYYEERGLIQSAGRQGLRRLYDASILDRLALIGAAQRAGFSLAEVGELISGRTDDAELKARLAEKADAIDRRIAELGAMRDRLRHAVHCRHPSLAECPHFLKNVRGAEAAGKPARVRRVDRGSGS